MFFSDISILKVIYSIGSVLIWSDATIVYVRDKKTTCEIPFKKQKIKKNPHGFQKISSILK